MGQVSNASSESAATQVGRPSAGLGRDVDLLRALASPEARRAGGLGVNRLAEITGREKSQVSRALRALASVGFVARDPETRRYAIGWQLIALTAGSPEMHMLEEARGPMDDLLSELDESVHLCVLYGTDVMTLITQFPHGRRAPGLTAPVVPAYQTSAGRVLLSDHSEAQLAAKFAGTDFSIAGPTARVRNVADLADTIRDVRETGYATVDEELRSGVVGASAPVRDHTGQVRAALNVSAQKSRVTDLDTMGRTTARAARRLSHALGWVDSPLDALGLS